MDQDALARLTATLRSAWGPDTCAPEDRADWTADNPSRGQCITTVLVVHDAFGGRLVRGEVHVGTRHVDYHWWNRLPDGSEIDLTRDQFLPHERVVGSTLVERPRGTTRTDEQYALLKARVDDALGACSNQGADPSVRPCPSAPRTRDQTSNLRADGGGRTEGPAPSCEHTHEPAAGQVSAADPRRPI